MTVTQTIPWYAKHDNLVTLTAFLAENAYTKAREIADAVEKPWKYEDEFRLAWAIREHEHATNHRITAGSVEGDYHCDINCPWEYEQDDKHVKQCVALRHGYTDIAGSYDVGDLPCDCGTDAVVAS